jgi:hypothetical protein
MLDARTAIGFSLKALLPAVPWDTAAAILKIYIQNEL